MGNSINYRPSRDFCATLRIITMDFEWFYFYLLRSFVVDDFPELM